MSEHTRGTLTESDVVSLRMIARSHGFVRRLDAHFDVTIQLRAQRDELLAACKRFVAWIDAGQPSDWKNVVSDAEAAIANAQGVQG